MWYVVNTCFGQVLDGVLPFSDHRPRGTFSFSRSTPKTPYSGSLWEGLVLIVGTESSAVLTSGFFVLRQFRRWDTSIPKVLRSTQERLKCCTDSSVLTFPSVRAMYASSDKPWSDRPNAPYLSRLLYHAEKEGFAGSFACAILYGTTVHTLVYPHSPFSLGPLFQEYLSLYSSGV